MECYSIYNFFVYIVAFQFFFVEGILPNHVTIGCVVMCLIYMFVFNTEKWNVIVYIISLCILLHSIFLCWKHFIQLCHNCLCCFNHILVWMWCTIEHIFICFWFSGVWGYGLWLKIFLKDNNLTTWHICCNDNWR
jgi:hypothetical protein